MKRVSAIFTRPSPMNLAKLMLVSRRQTMCAKTGFTTKATITRPSRRMPALPTGNPCLPIPSAANSPHVGGGFGGKSDPFSHEICACELSRRTGRPVKITCTREEVFLLHRGRHPVKMWIKTGVKRDGTLTAMHFRSFLDGGAYGSYGIATTYYTGALQTVTYTLPCYKFEGMRLFTNKPPCGPKRGHGTTQPRYAVEVHLDKIAHDLGIDPVEFRRRNLIEPYTRTINGLRITTCALGPCLDQVVARSHWNEFHSAQAMTSLSSNGHVADTAISPPPSHSRGGGGVDEGRGPLRSPSAGLGLPEGNAASIQRGMGIAASSYICGAGKPIYWNDLPHSAVQIRLDRGGGVTVYCGATDIGQGSTSILAYIVAEELGVQPGHIHLETADTTLTPVDLGSYSSRVTFMAGNAAIAAALKLKGQLFEAVSAQLLVPEERLRAENGVIYDEDDPGTSLSFIQAVQLAEARYGALVASGSYAPPEGIHGDYKGAGVGPSPAYSYSACVAQVAVDVETGEVVVEKLWLAHDVGQSINPLLVAGQVEGGALDYKLPTTLDTPEIETILVEIPDREGPFGGKEAGQGPLNPVIPAIANAVYDAVGVRIDETPITADKLLKALRAEVTPARSAPRPQVMPSEAPSPWPTRLIKWPPEEKGVR
ncbi:MAG: hypothetical protein E6I93_13525 [Chloroflexi bacterium]|nr:MAG: hypothetical protein E6I93_13525 [Chloroflexota bacterium]